MKIYGVNYSDEVMTETFVPSKSAALRQAKNPDRHVAYIIEYEIGRVTKEVICKLANGTGFAISSREIWNDEEGERQGSPIPNAE